MDKIRVGFIGCGNHSTRSLYPALRGAGLQLVAVCDESREKAEERGAEYNVKGVYTDYRKMCDSENMDAVLIAIGPQQHYELSVELLKRGYHVWTEKPCAASAAQADEMAATSKKVGRVCQTGFNYRFTTGILQAKEMIESGRFGSPAMTTVHWWLGITDQEQYRLHYMVHPVDLYLHLMPGELRSRHIEHHRRDEFDYFSVTSRGVDGRIAVLELAANMGMGSRWAQVDWLSKDGRLTVRDFTEVLHFGNGSRGYFSNPDAEPYGGDRVWSTESLFNRGSFVEEWGYTRELDAFRQAALGQRPAEATIAEAALGMHLCEEMMETADRR